MTEKTNNDELIERILNNNIIGGHELCVASDVPENPSINCVETGIYGNEIISLATELKELREIVENIQKWMPLKDKQK
jgi:hypothetical protein